MNDSSRKKSKNTFANPSKSESDELAFTTATMGRQGKSRGERGPSFGSNQTTRDLRQVGKNATKTPPESVTSETNSQDSSSNSGKEDGSSITFVHRFMDSLLKTYGKSGAVMNPVNTKRRMERRR